MSGGRGRGPAEGGDCGAEAAPAAPPLRVFIIQAAPDSDYLANDEVQLTMADSRGRTFALRLVSTGGHLARFAGVVVDPGTVVVTRARPGEPVAVQYGLFGGMEYPSLVVDGRDGTYAALWRRPESRPATPRGPPRKPEVIMARGPVDAIPPDDMRQVERWCSGNVVLDPLGTPLARFLCTG